MMSKYITSKDDNIQPKISRYYQHYVLLIMGFLAGSKMGKRSSERGQVLVIVALAMIVLLAFTALGIDGGRLFMERINAQTAADAAALAGALAKCQNQNVTAAALDIAQTNGYNNDGSSNSVAVYSPPISGSYDSDHVEVVIISTIEKSFAHFIYGGPLQNTVRAVTRCIEVTGGGGAAIFAGSEICPNTIDWPGSVTSLVGGVHSNNDITVSGSSNSVKGEVTYVTTVDESGEITYEPPPPDNPVQTTVQPYPVHYQIEEYAPDGIKAIEADDKGEYYSCECRMDMAWLMDNGYFNDSTKVLKSGLYYTTEEIELQHSDIIGHGVTLVSRNVISINGSNQQLNHDPDDPELTPYVDGLLAFTDMKYSNSVDQCVKFVIKMEGSTNQWSGVIYAPYGQIEMAGSDDTTLNGSLFGYTVKLNGSALNLKYDEELFPTVREISLIE